MTDRKDPKLGQGPVDWPGAAEEPPKSQAAPPKPPPRPPRGGGPPAVTPRNKPPPPGSSEAVAPATSRSPLIAAPASARTESAAPATSRSPTTAARVVIPDVDHAPPAPPAERESPSPATELAERPLVDGRYRIHSPKVVEGANLQPAPPAPPPRALDWLDHLLASDALPPNSTGVAARGEQGRSFEPDRPSSTASPDGFDADVNPFAQASREPAAGQRWESGLCTFWIGPRCFALDIDVVGEVVDIETVVDVPLTPAALVGLFNLRGMPVALVDLAQVLSLGGAARVTNPEANHSLRALVLRGEGFTAAALIDRVEAVVPPGREELIRTHTGDNPIVQGFIKSATLTLPVITVLDAHAVMQRIELLKHSVGTPKSRSQ